MVYMKVTGQVPSGPSASNSTLNFPEAQNLCSIWLRFWLKCVKNEAGGDGELLLVLVLGIAVDRGFVSLRQGFLLLV